MSPKIISFKSVFDNIDSRKESTQDSSSCTQTPNPLVYRSPVISTNVYSGDNHKRLSVTRPLKISSSFDGSDLESDNKDNSVEMIDSFSYSQLLDKQPSTPKKSNIVDTYVNNFSDHFKQYVPTDKDEESNNVFNNSSTSPNSSHTTTFDQFVSDDLFSEYEYKYDSEYNTSLSNLYSSSRTTATDYTPMGSKTQSENSMMTNRVDSHDSFSDTYKLKIDSMSFSDMSCTIDGSQFSDKYGLSQTILSSGPIVESLDVEYSQPTLIRDDQSDDDNHIKILVFTDTHLGFKEDDTYRGDDSINTFEEILYIAKHLEVDCILHSGDLFDKNVPSRRTMYRTMDLLSKYLIKDDKTIKVDTSRALDKVYDRVNKTNNKTHDSELYDYYFNSSAYEEQTRIPFFVIHGNHDSPTYQNSLSPIDILDVAGLVTYFGRVFDLNNILVKPILLSKNNVKIAIYGIGWIKDERLVELFSQNKVNFELFDDFDDYYKILLLHQNRYPRKGFSTKDYLNNEVIPEWFDLVIWGHEHECFKLPQKNELDNFHILQIGSSIQTCLVPAEVPSKHACLIRVYNDLVDFYPISLMTSRKVIYEELPVNTSIDTTKLNDNKNMEDDLRHKVNKILQNNGNNFTTVLNSVSLSETLELQEITTIKNLLYNSSCPLVRIKVDGLYDPINPKIFGNYFTGKVANPNDMLKITYKKEEKDESTEFVPGHSNKNIQEEVLSTIADNCELEILLETELNDAVNRFAVGMEAQVIVEYVKKRVSKVQQYTKEQMKKQNTQMPDDVCSNLIEGLIRDKTLSDRKGGYYKNIESYFKDSAEEENIKINKNLLKRSKKYFDALKNHPNNKRRKNNSKNNKCVE